MFSNLFIATLFAACISASLMQRRQQEARVITTCTKPNTAALTFDDGPYDVSKALVAANATGTSFFNGNNYACIYDADEMKRVQYIYGKSHQVASHTWSHSDLTTLTWDQTCFSRSSLYFGNLTISFLPVHDEMWRVEQALTKIVGVVPAFIRPPYGNYNSLILQASFIRGQVIAAWEFDSRDSIGATPAQSKASYDQLVEF